MAYMFANLFFSAGRIDRMRAYSQHLTHNSQLNSLLAIAFAIISISCQGQSPDTNLPNIIYIMADDLGYADLGCYGQTKIETPHIDSLAADGIKLTQHYAGSPVCAPSRSALLTGQHTGHTFIRGNKEVQPEGQFPLPANENTIPKMLKQAGYTTGTFGKWGLGFPGSEGDPVNQGIDDFYGYNCQRLAHNYYPEHLWNNKEKVILEQNAGEAEGAYAPVLIHEKALEFIDINKNKPFFLFYATNLPHAELAAPEAYLEKYREKFGEEKPFNGVDNGPRFKQGAYGSQASPHAAYAAMVSLLDDQVGEIRAKLRELGIAKNTLIIFTSDNGPHQEGGNDPDFFISNGDLIGYKRDLYEGGIRVPMIATWPGKIEAGSTSDHVSAFWDVLPTFSAIAGKPTPEATDGISFLPALSGKKQQAHEYLYWEFHEEGGKQAVRKGDWKGVRLDVNRVPDGPIELYNLATDISEKNNVAAENPEIVAEMAGIMKTAHEPSAEFSFAGEKVGNLEK